MDIISIEISTLNLDFNKLTSLSQLCSLKCCLVNLHIGYNNITRLDKHFLKGYNKLQEINLNKNNLLVLPDLHWVQYSLKTIMTSDNNIQSLDALETTGVYPKLSYVDVSRNNIHNFNVSLLRHMPKLHFLLLDGNRLTHVDDFRSLNVRVILLENNPWHCGEELSWMGEEDLGFERGLTCATPTCLEGMVVAEMSNLILSHTLYVLIIWRG